MNVNNSNWLPIAKCTAITSWRAIQTLKNHAVDGITYPFMKKDVSNRWIGNDGVFNEWIAQTIKRQSNRR